MVAKGHPPERRDLVLDAGERAEDFKLGAPNSLRVSFVDEAGAPVPKAALVVGSWRGGDSLYGAGVPQRANAEGAYAWDWAPAGPVSFEAIAAGFQRQKLDLSADGKTQTVTLRRTPVVAGSLTDARTGKPVSGARVTPVIDFGGDLYAVERQSSFKAEGSYRAEFERSDCDYRLLVEAPGYRTAISRAGLAQGPHQRRGLQARTRARRWPGRVLDAVRQAGERGEGVTGHQRAGLALPRRQSARTSARPPNAGRGVQFAGAGRALRAVRRAPEPATAQRRAQAPTTRPAT